VRRSIVVSCFAYGECFVSVLSLELEEVRLLFSGSGCPIFISVSHVPYVLLLVSGSASGRLWSENYG